MSAFWTLITEQESCALISDAGAPLNYAHLTSLTDSMAEMWICFVPKSIVA